jgi:acyl carrier protein
MNTQEILHHLVTCLPRLAPELRAETHLAELALDSLDTVELLCVIHAEFGVRLTESEFHPGQTIGGLLEVISARGESANPSTHLLSL